MTTAQQIVDGAAQHAGVKTAEIALEPDDFQVIFDTMNDMLLEWADLGLTPAFNEVFNSSDVVEIDNNARAAVKASLAIRISPAFDKQITTGLLGLVTDTLARLEASTDFIGEIAFPDTLPLGSGNQCPDSDIDQRFFQAGKKENF